MQAKAVSRTQSIADTLRQQIEEGVWQTGALLPSSRQIAMDYGVSLNTAQAVLRQLEGQNLIECQPRRRAVLKSRERIGTGTLVAMISSTDPSLPRDRHIAPDVFFSAERLLTDFGLVLTNLTEQMLDASAQQSVVDRLKRFGSSLAGAILLTRHERDVPLFEVLRQRGIPTVMINRPTDSVTNNYVTPDWSSAGRTAGRIFAALGCRRILVIYSGSMCLWHRQKLLGLVDGYIQADQPIPMIDRVIPGEENMPAAALGAHAMRTYLKDHKPPDAVLATGDFIGLGAVQALHEAGLSVPDDVNVIGMTGLDISAHFEVPETVIGLPRRELGVTAAEMILKLIDQPSQARLPGVEMPCPVVLRKSVTVTDAVRAVVADLTAAMPYG